MGRFRGISGFFRRDRDRFSVGIRGISVVSVGNERRDRTKCRYCGKWYSGSCRFYDRFCYKCGSVDYFIKDCPRLSEQNVNQSGKSGVITVRGRLFRNTGNVSGGQRGFRDDIIRSEVRASVRVYVIRVREDVFSSDVITGIFIFFVINVIVLIDSGFIYLYVCMKLVFSMNISVENTEFMIRVSNPLGKCVIIDKVCKKCFLMIRGYYFPVDLMLLLFDEFDVILGMDWLILYDAIVNCKEKVIELKCESGEILRVESDKSEVLFSMIFSMSVQRYLRKGYEVYLVYVMNTELSELKFELVLIVCEFSDVFSEELSGLFLIREVEFVIELVLGILPILIVLYRMVSTELKELKF